MPKDDGSYSIAKGNGFPDCMTFIDGEIEVMIEDLFSGDRHYFSLDEKETRELYEFMKKYYE